MKIKEIHDLFKQLSDESQEGYYSHEEIDVFLDRASSWMQNECKRLFGEGIDTHECMAPFKRRWDFTSDDFDAEEGILTIPAEHMFERLSNITIISQDNESGTSRESVDIVNEDDLDYRLRSQLNPVTAEKPIATVEGIGKWQFHPKGEYNGIVRFIKRPNKPHFKYTQDGRVIEHDAAGSTDLEWGEGYITQVIFKAITLAGFNLNSEVLIQAGLMMDTKKP